MCYRISMINAYLLKETLNYVFHNYKKNMSQQTSELKKENHAMLSENSWHAIWSILTMKPHFFGFFYSMWDSLACESMSTEIRKKLSQTSLILKENTTIEQIHRRNCEYIKTLT